MVFTRHASRLSQKNHENRSNPNHDTPTKAGLRAAYKHHITLLPHGFTNATNTNQALFKSLDIALSSAYRILASQSIEQSDQTFHNQPDVTETRGRPKTIINEDLNVMDAILRDSDT